MDDPPPPAGRAPASRRGKLDLWLTEALERSPERYYNVVIVFDGPRDAAALRRLGINAFASDRGTALMRGDEITTMADRPDVQGITWLGEPEPTEEGGA